MPRGGVGIYPLQVELLYRDIVPNSKELTHFCAVGTPHEHPPIPADTTLTSQKRTKMFHSPILSRTVTRFAKKKFFTSTREQNLEHKTQWLGNGVITDVYDKYEALKNVKEKSSLKSALKRFRDIVQRETKRKGYHFYAGWPPRNRIKITEDEKLGLYGRTVFVINRVKGVKEVEPNLCICCKNKNVLFFNKPEFESLLKNMDSIKHQLQEFGKKL